MEREQTGGRSNFTCPQPNGWSPEAVLIAILSDPMEPPWSPGGAKRAGNARVWTGRLLRAKCSALRKVGLQRSESGYDIVRDFFE